MKREIIAATALSVGLAGCTPESSSNSGPVDPATNKRVVELDKNQRSAVIKLDKHSTFIVQCIGNTLVSAQKPDYAGGGDPVELESEMCEDAKISPAEINASEIGSKNLRSIKVSEDGGFAELHISEDFKFLLQCIGTATVISQNPDYAGGGDPVQIPGDICKDGKIVPSEI